MLCSRPFLSVGAPSAGLICIALDSPRFPEHLGHGQQHPHDLPLGGNADLGMLQASQTPDVQQGCCGWSSPHTESLRRDRAQNLLGWSWNAGCPPSFRPWRAVESSTQAWNTEKCSWSEVKFGIESALRLFSMRKSAPSRKTPARGISCSGSKMLQKGAESFEK